MEHMDHMGKARKALSKHHERTRVMEKIGLELKKNPPSVLKKTAKKFGKKRAAKQKVAILLSKARKAGLKIAPKA